MADQHRKRATGPKNITETMLRRALQKHAGVMVLAARELGCDRSNVKHRIDRSPALQAFLAGIEDEVGDLAEGVIVSALLAKDKATARWYAERKLRNRGYVTRQEQTGPDGAALTSQATVNINVSYVTGQPGPETEEDEII